MGVLVEDVEPLDPDSEKGQRIAAALFAVLDAAEARIARDKAKAKREAKAKRDAVRAEKSAAPVTQKPARDRK